MKIRLLLSLIINLFLGLNSQAQESYVDYAGFRWYTQSCVLISIREVDLYAEPDINSEILLNTGNVIMSPVFVTDISHQWFYVYYAKLKLFGYVRENFVFELNDSACADIPVLSETLFTGITYPANLALSIFREAETNLFPIYFDIGAVLCLSDECRFIEADKIYNSLDQSFDHVTTCFASDCNEMVESCLPLTNVQDFYAFDTQECQSVLEIKYEIENAEQGQIILVEYDQIYALPSIFDICYLVYSRSIDDLAYDCIKDGVLFNIKVYANRYIPNSNSGLIFVYSNVYWDYRIQFTDKLSDYACLYFNPSASIRIENFAGNILRVCPDPNNDIVFINLINERDIEDGIFVIDEFDNFHVLMSYIRVYFDIEYDPNAISR